MFLSDEAAHFIGSQHLYEMKQASTTEPHVNQPSWTGNQVWLHGQRDGTDTPVHVVIVDGLVS